MGLNITEFLNDTYEVLASLDQEGKTVLVRRKGTNAVYVRKEIDSSVVELYRNLAKVDSLNIAKIENVYENEGKYFVIEEYVNGSTIQELIDYNRSVSEKEAVDYCVQILKALSIIHSMGIVHRDITPKNVVISNDGVVKLIDFGIARMDNPNKTQDTTILGTVGFAAPEQYGFSQTNEKSDIYSVGVLLNLLLTNRMPNVALPVNSRLNMIVRKSTNINPNARYKSAKHMIAALNKTPLIAPLPGFRSGMLWKKIIACIVYANCWFIFLIFALDGIFINRQDFAVEITSGFLAFVATPFVAGNIYNWDRQIPVLRVLPMPIRFIIRVLVAFIIFYIGMEMFVGSYKAS